ncbi:tetratricopeptide repeat protein [Oleisolibacter albus]|uniref:tetratricopeptide repeat protein n=1 Tax=Oleisolibacter albus TaxID=2171757 RepID=UPI000DF3BD52|nr:tetratricopeptide repeat protein [Oleisolibacter albus]
MSDIFREVDEDLRRDQLTQIWKRYGSLIVAGAVLLVVGVAGYVVWERWHKARMEERTSALVQAMQPLRPAEGKAPDAAAAIANLDAATKQLTGSHATLAQLQQAALLVRDGKIEAAVSVYDRIAADATADRQFRDLAALLSVTHRLDSADPGQLQAQLLPLTAPDNAWRWSARELSGLVAARQGDTARAHDLFRQLADDPETPPGTRSRASELAALYQPSK